jgi:hypothetical protein
MTTKPTAVLQIHCSVCGSFSVPVPWPRSEGKLDPCWPCEHLSMLFAEHMRDGDLATVEAGIGSHQKAREQLIEAGLLPSYWKPTDPVEGMKKRIAREEL